jgi:uncharacterized protein YifN (PemK superfamily)
MTLAFQPRRGQIVMCDYSGNRVPEMIKVRPVVVIARNRKNRQLVTVVPLSTTAPNTLEEHHHLLGVNPLPGREEIECWAKCDMISTVSLARLDRFKTAHRQYVAPMLPKADFDAICLSVLKALGLADLAEGLQS